MGCEKVPDGWDYFFVFPKANGNIFGIGEIVVFPLVPMYNGENNMPNDWEYPNQEMELFQYNLVYQTLEEYKKLNKVSNIKKEKT